MKIEVLVMTEYEQEVIEAAIEYVQHKEFGLYKDKKIRYDNLRESVQDLLTENEGRWPQVET